jgi:tungstate transport system ATP-binding protein
MGDEPSILPLRLDSVCYEVPGRRLIDGLSFTIEAGGRTVILGPNGAGKSLTLRLCHGLIRPTAGRVEWLGPGSDRYLRRQAMVFQRPLMLRRSTRANLTHALALAGRPRSERDDLAMAALRRFGLEALADSPARVLSGGEQQRVAMARAWALRPQILFLDEPCASLDPAATAAIEDMIRAFHSEGITVVMTTHDMGQARRLADDVLFLHGGRLVERTPADTFFDAPQTEIATAFVRGELLW